MLKLASSYGLLQGIRASCGGPHITHLFFADDSLIFGDASVEGVRNVVHVLEEYECCSGQKINFNKSFLYFSANVFEPLRV